MVVVSSCCLILAFVLFVIGFRGRVIARGGFCRGCRFDLAGIDREGASARCPECGRRIGEGKHPRPVLRRIRRVVLAVAAVLLVVGGIGLFMGTSGKASMLMGVFPDGTIVWLTERGIDEALDELALRAANTNSPMSDALLARSIGLALAHQADASVPWDPRWGEVLLVNFEHPVFTDEQRMQCLRNGFAVDIEMADRLRQGDEALYCTLNFEYARFTSLSRPPIPGWLKLHPIELTADGHDQDLRAGFGSFSVALSPRLGLPNQTFRYGQAPLHIQLEDLTPRAIDVRLRYEIAYQPVAAPPRPLRAFTKSMEIELIPGDQPAASLLQDEVIADRIRRSVQVSGLRVMRDLPDQSSSQENGPDAGGDAAPDRLPRAPWVMGLHCTVDALPEPIALRCVLRFSDGGTFDPGWTWVGAECSGRLNLAMRRRGMYWPGGEWLNQQREQAQEMLDRLRDAGRVDLLLRTDPTLANEVPGIDRVIDLNLIVRDLAVEWIDKQQEPSVLPTQYDQWRTPEPINGSLGEQGAP